MTLWLCRELGKLNWCVRLGAIIRYWLYAPRQRQGKCNFQRISSLDSIPCLILGCHFAGLAWCQRDFPWRPCLGRFLSTVMWASFIIVLLLSLLWFGSCMDFMVSTTHMCSLPLLKVGRGAVNQPAANCCMVDRASVVGDSFRTFRHLDSENLRDSLESLGLSIKQNVRVQRFVNILQIVMENSYSLLFALSCWHASNDAASSENGGVSWSWQSDNMSCT